MMKQKAYGRSPAIASDHIKPKSRNRLNDSPNSTPPITNSTANDTFPAWSPDGTKIAFQSDRDGNTNIYVMNTDGTGQVSLTNSPANDSSSTWSPDGTKIAFQSDRDGNSEIYVMNFDGSGQSRLTNNAATDGDPAWSPR